MTTTKEPVTLSGWYEHDDGTVGEYRLNQYGAQLARTVASWAEVPSREDDIADEVAATSAYRAAR